MRKVVIFSHASVVPANRELFRELSRRFELRLVCPRAWKGSLIRDLEAAPESDLITLPTVFSGNGSLFFYRSLLREVRAFGPDCIFLDEEPWSLAALQVYLMFPGVPKVFYTKQNLQKRVPAPFSWIQKRVLRDSKGAFVISKEAGEVLRWKNYAGPMELLPHSLNREKFRPLAPEQRAERRQRFGLPPADFLVGYFGRLTEEKGVRDFFAAAQKITLEHGTRDRPISFVTVGNGPLLGLAKEFAAKFPHRIFPLPALGHGDVHELMAAMDLTVLPSRTTPRWKEQFGRVIIESAACGVPVIGSDSGEIPLLIEAAECGWSYREGDVTSLGNRIRELAADSEAVSSCAARGQEVVAEKFTHEAVGARLSSQLQGFGIDASSSRCNSSL